MDFITAEKMAKQLMALHGLNEWNFKWIKTISIAGRCNYPKKLIMLSCKIVLINDESNVRNTILHEIAHALTPGKGHSKEWKRKAKEIGCTAQRCGGFISPYRYIAKCSTANCSVSGK